VVPSRDCQVVVEQHLPVAASRERSRVASA
jgi:hypothetical protein